MSAFDYVTGSSTLPYSSSIAVPIVGSPITATSVRHGFRSLADRTMYLSGVLGPISTSYASLSSSADTKLTLLYNRFNIPTQVTATYVTMSVPFAPFISTVQGYGVGSYTIYSPDWATSFTYHGRPAQVTASSGINNYLYLSLDFVPHNAYLEKLEIEIDPTNGHGSLPGIMPAIGIRQINTTGGETSLFTISDNSANVAAYEAAHTITSSLNHRFTFDKLNYSYYMFIRGESPTTWVGPVVLDYVNIIFTFASKSWGA